VPSPAAVGGGFDEESEILRESRTPVKRQGVPFDDDEPTPKNDRGDAELREPGAAARHGGLSFLDSG
jgi:hypothetical protein